MPLLYSFVTEKKSKKKLDLLQSSNWPTYPAGIKVKILKASLTANNKFYLDFGERPPFNFFKCYPVPNEGSKLVKNTEGDIRATTDYVHPPIWGLCEITESNIPDVAPVGSIYRAMLPLGTSVEFEKAHIEPTQDQLVIHRPTTNAAYNAFTPIPKDSVCHIDSAHSSLALACYPGIITGFGLYFHLQHDEYYGCDTIVITSASSKVALALALYLKHHNAGKKIIGYTSDSNRSFVESTRLYDALLGYSDALPSSCSSSGGVVMIDIAGKGSLYVQNQDKVTKLLALGNSSDSPEKESTFAKFPLLASIKMIMTMMRMPPWITDCMHVKQELYLVWNTTEFLLKQWGKDKFKQEVETHAKLFCDAATNNWGLMVRNCNTEEEIQKAFEEIIQGTVSPKECLVLDVAKAVDHRMKE